MYNLVKINYNGKELIGQIIEIESVWERTNAFNGYTGQAVDDLVYYSVSLRENKTDLIIKNIIIRDIAKIEILRDIQGGETD